MQGKNRQKADDSMEGGGRAMHGAIADDSMEGGGRAPKAPKALGLCSRLDPTGSLPGTVAMLRACPEVCPAKCIGYKTLWVF